jgi:DNA-binding transcriptional ArsR family regulator
MTTPFERLAELDRLVHEPARLAVLSALSACESADFLYLRRITGLSKGNLSSHLARLEEAGLVTVAKEFVGRVPRTTVALTAHGRDRLDAHWRDLDRLARDARRWRPGPQD